MHSIDIQFEVKHPHTSVQVFVNDKPCAINGNKVHVENLAQHKTHYIEFKSADGGQITVEKLILDGIDTEYFTHHGFIENSGRGNSSNSTVKYYFNVPVWDWFLTWKENDNSTTRMLSKTHQGFIPL